MADVNKRKRFCLLITEKVLFFKGGDFVEITQGFGVILLPCSAGRVC